MASAYGGVHAAIAAVMGLKRRIKTGQGQRIEVPLADAVLSSMALLIMKVEGQPRRFDLPPIDKAMTEVAFPILRELGDQLSGERHGRIRDYLSGFGRPQFGNHRCGDGRSIFINAVDHVHHAKACLEVLGLLDELIAEGMIVGSPYEEGGEGNNISYSAGLSAVSRMTMWFGIDVNQGKRAIILDLKSAEGRSVLEKLVRQSDVVIHNFLDRSAAKIGISDEQLREINPEIISCQVSAWGGPSGGPFKDDPAFDPVLQAATGITTRYGTPEAPVLHGIASCVDYITGFSAALGVAQALVARELGRGGAHVRTSLSMGAQLVQFPFTVASARQARPAEPSGQGTVGYGAHYRHYRARDGWAFLACRAQDLRKVAEQLGAVGSTEQCISDAIGGMTCTVAAERLRPIKSASVPRVTRLDELRESSTIGAPEQFRKTGKHLAMVRSAHPSGYRVSLPLPTWYRFESETVEPLAAAPAPGSDTRSVLAELGLQDAELHRLLTTGAARAGWSILKHYLPL